MQAALTGNGANLMGICSSTIDKTHALITKRHELYWEHTNDAPLEI